MQLFFAECKKNFVRPRDFFRPPSANEIPAFAGMGLKRFRLSPEWRYFLFLRTMLNLAVSENIKNPPFRRKPESPSPKANPPFPPLPQSHFPHPSHSCEGRNLHRRKAAGNCTFVRLRRQFAPFGAEIPAFAGMGRGGVLWNKGENPKCRHSAVCASRKEIPAFAGMAALFVFADNTEFGGIQKYKKKPPFRRKFILANAGTGISLIPFPRTRESHAERRIRLLRRRADAV
ncbi:MAG: hypothetical protein ACR2QC_00585 [Gammaproteobacteria bacterium]